MKRPVFILISMIVLFSATGIIYYFSDRENNQPPAIARTNTVPDTSRIVPDTIFIGESIAEIHPPVSGLDIKYRSFRIKGNKAHHLRLPSGTTIDIPAYAFMDKNGKTINNLLTLKYREFHDAADIFVSGIPMEIKLGDKIRHLSTAGMFDIRAENQEGELTLSKGKKLNVTMASQTRGNGYDAYYFAENREGWIKTGKSKILSDPELLQIRKVKADISEEMINIPLG